MLPDGAQVEGQPIRVKLAGREDSLQLKRVPSEKTGATQLWTLIGRGGELIAQADAAINPDGSAFTEQ